MSMSRGDSFARATAALRRHQRALREEARDAALGACGPYTRTLPAAEVAAQRDRMEWAYEREDKVIAALGRIRDYAADPRPRIRNERFHHSARGARVVWLSQHAPLYAQLDAILGPGSSRPVCDGPRTTWHAADGAARLLWVHDTWADARAIVERLRELVATDAVATGLPLSMLAALCREGVRPLLCLMEQVSIAGPRDPARDVDLGRGAGARRMRFAGLWRVAGVQLVGEDGTTRDAAAVCGR